MSPREYFDGSTSGGAEKRRRTLEFSLYCASIILGAGILGLPAQTATIGLLPAITMVILLGLILSRVYERIATTIHEAVEKRAEDRLAWVESRLPERDVDSRQRQEVVRSQIRFLADRLGMGIIDAIFEWLGFGR